MHKDICYIFDATHDKIDEVARTFMFVGVLKSEYQMIFKSRFIAMRNPARRVALIGKVKEWAVAAGGGLEWRVELSEVSMSDGGLADINSSVYVGNEYIANDCLELVQSAFADGVETQLRPECPPLSLKMDAAVKAMSIQYDVPLDNIKICITN